jgi:hypothetical protein
VPFVFRHPYLPLHTTRKNMTTTTPTPTLPEHRFIDDRGKMLRYEWKIGDPFTDESERGPQQRVAVLSIDHYGRSEIAGRPEYMYVARLDIVTDIDAGGYTIRRHTFTYGRGAGGTILRRNDVKRRGAKSMREFGAEALTVLARLLDERDERATSVFEADQRVARERTR